MRTVGHDRFSLLFFSLHVDALLVGIAAFSGAEIIRWVTCVISSPCTFYVSILIVCHVSLLSASEVWSVGGGRFFFCIGACTSIIVEA